METYKPLSKGQYYIDKTEGLEKGIGVFPSIYIEGAAASGKTTAVQMLLAHHPEVESVVLWMDEEMQCVPAFQEKIAAIREHMEETAVWVVLENIPQELPEEVEEKIIWLVRHLPEESRVIMTGREQPDATLLELLWKREMELFPQKMLSLRQDEIRILAEQMGSRLDPAELYEATGGWAGCVLLMMELSNGDGDEKNAGEQKGSARRLRERYEIDTYIQRQILDILSQKEQEVLRWGQVCPWLNEAFCREFWEMEEAEVVLQALTRKGLLTYSATSRRWKVAPLFQNQKEVQKFAQSEPSSFWKNLGNWYEAHGCIKELLWCLKQSDDEAERRKIWKKYYDQIPFLEGASWTEALQDVMEWKEQTPEVCYLRGMYCWQRMDLNGLNQEIKKLDKFLQESDAEAEQKEKLEEIYLNLCYVKPDLTVDEWLERIERVRKGRKLSLHLYGIPGKSFSCLNGMRDLAGLFACAKKEENRKAKIWKEYLDEEAWTLYQLARTEYYLETERGDSILEEDQELLCRIAKEKGKSALENYRLSAFYLLCHLQRRQPKEEVELMADRLEQELLSSEEDYQKTGAEAIGSLYAPWRKHPEKLTHWLHYTGTISERNQIEQQVNVRYCQAKGYLFLNQYEKAEKMLQSLTVYFHERHSNRFLAEVLFEQAIVDWNLGRHGKALRNTIESFLVNGNSRYVGFYTEYGKNGMAVLESYVEWMKSNSPEGWRRKKKYNYGNVLRMPEADYMEVILRCAKRETRSMPAMAEQKATERLTMMETIVLQDIGRGLNNMEICEELNLKLPTVKSHIYSLYKKLGVNNRVQAVIRGKELGIVE